MSKLMPLKIKNGKGKGEEKIPCRKIVPKTFKIWTFHDCDKVLPEMLQLSLDATEKYL